MRKGRRVRVGPFLTLLHSLIKRMLCRPFPDSSNLRHVDGLNFNVGDIVIYCLIIDEPRQTLSGAPKCCLSHLVQATTRSCYREDEHDVLLSYFPYPLWQRKQKPQSFDCGFCFLVLDVWHKRHESCALYSSSEVSLCFCGHVCTTTIEHASVRVHISLKAHNVLVVNVVCRLAGFFYFGHNFIS